MRAHAVLDVEDKGPTLRAGRFAMRVTNAGILGNAFFDVGRSYDPSFEYPRGSGNELMNHTELWVGAIDDRGFKRVSGGPMLEWRPTLDPADHVHEAWADRPGTKRGVDDDGDGRVDEEILNGKDDDGDGEIDEDLGMFAQQELAADYVDDRPEAIFYGYPTGESHVALGLSVHQEAYAWSMPGEDRFAGLHFHITNHGSSVLHQLYVGLFADLDSRNRADASGHLNDRVRWVTYSRDVFKGVSNVVWNGTAGSPPTITCIDRLRQTLPAVVDGIPGSGLPCVAVVPLDHTTDPFALIGPLKSYARAPGSVSFHTAVFRRGDAPGSGGIPAIDDQRYDALSGADPGNTRDELGDWVVLVSCGPFPSLGPGQSIDFDAGIVAADSPESLAVAMGELAVVQHGTELNLLPDSTRGPWPNNWDEGVSGKNGHEVCIDPPPGVSFTYDPHCPGKLVSQFLEPGETPVRYAHGHCVWTDADCDQCTGLNGNETVQRWLDPGEVPPAPRYATTPADHGVSVAWDNYPEVLLAGGQIGGTESRFLGYRLYRIADWSGRQSLLPPPDNWALVSAFGSDTLNGEKTLRSVTDSTLDYDRILYEQKLYPVGRYRFVDTQAKNGFTYVYALTSVVQLVKRKPDGTPIRRVVESPLLATFDQAVRPRAEAPPASGKVWVVPNPFRAAAAWDLPPVDGDRLTRHLDFMGLPRARSVIKIWTVAGDLVQTLDHDGSRGDGEAAWDLVSRNGQEVVSGIYLFTVDSPLGHQVGHFVVIR